MDAHLDCGPCVLRQAIDAARRTGASEQTQKQVLKQAADAISEMRFDETPMALASRVQQVVREETKSDDPFAETKEIANEEVQKLLPAFERRLERADDRFETAVRLAIAGNIIDVGPGHEIDIEETVEDVLEQPFAIDHLDTLRTDLESAENVLYLADNAGEIVLDRLLVGELDATVEVVVKDQPFLNDALFRDAQTAGIGEVSTVRTRGSDGVGTVSPAFERRLRDADVVISKGQGNYELFSESEANMYFLFIVKCAVVADDIGAPEGRIVCSQ
ncbi:MAG: damage-control phosphatase ARMT1 family protein [Halapricum sp.]